MQRSVLKPTLNQADYILSVEKGGIGTTNTATLATSLSLINNSLVNASNGVLGIGEDGKVPVLKLPSNVLASPISVSGPADLYHTETGTYKITDYIEGYPYTLYIGTGSGTSVGDTITYTAPSSGFSGIFQINDIAVQPILKPILPNIPSILAPIDNAVDQPLEVTIASSAFSIWNNLDTHIASSWDLSTVPNFSSTVATLWNDATNLTTWTVSGLLPNTTYYVRCMHKGAIYGWTNQPSAVSTFTTIGAPQYNETNALTASDYSDHDGYSAQFGQSVAISGDGTRCIVGSINTVNYGYQTGSCYIFVRSGAIWTQEAILLGAEAEAGDWMGFACAIDNNGTRVVITAPYGNPGSIYQSGKAYVFTRSGTTWTQEVLLIASDKATYDMFGFSVAIDSTASICAVGMPYPGGGGISSGKVYIYARTGTVWVEKAILTGSLSSIDDYFGYAVSLSGDGIRCIVGAQNTDHSSLTNNGIAYVFFRTGVDWTEETTISGSGNSANGRFGSCVSISSDGTRCVIGAYGEKPSDLAYAGKAYIFLRSGTTWTEEAVLSASDKLANDYFGTAASTNGDCSVICIAALNKDIGALEDAGQVYVFTRSGTTWTESKIIASTDIMAYATFGTSVSITNDGTILIVGDYIATVGGVIGAGKARLYS